MKEINSNSRSFRKLNPQLYPHENYTQTEVPDAKPRKREKQLEADHGREAPSAGRVHVCFTLRRVRLLDVDAKVSSVKDLLDCCTTSGLIHGDQEGQITLEVNQEKVGHFKEEATIIDIECHEP